VIVPPVQVLTTTQAGARYVRLNFRLGAAADWTDAHLLAGYDTVVQDYLNAGLQVLGLVTAEATHSTQADWTANNRENTPGANGDNAFISNTYVAGALQPLIAHFHDRIKIWELWNEPNSYASCSRTVCTGNSYIYPSNFAALLVDAYEAIKDPSGLGLSDVTLVSGGLLGHSIGGALTATNAGATYLSDTFTMGITTTATWAAFSASHGGRLPLDGIGQHIYVDQNLLTTATDVSAYYGWLHNAAATSPATSNEAPPPTYLTEAGWNTAPPSAGVPTLPQSIQAQNLDLLFSTTRGMGYVPQATWFDVQDIPGASLYFGLVDATGQPKEALSRFAAQAAAAPTATPTPPVPSPTPTPTPSPSPFSSPTPTPTPSATATPTATPSATGSPAATATALPSATYSCPGLDPTRTLGDINGDGTVDLTDFSIFASDFGKDTGQGAVLNSPYSDMNCDGKVDLTDFSIFASQYGR
jgi:hypothetical protein